MTDKTSTLKTPIKSKELAKRLISEAINHPENSKLNSRERKCARSIAYAALVAALLGSSACTLGPGGLVVGMRDIQDSHNERLKILNEAKEDGINDRDRAQFNAFLNNMK